MIGLNLTPMKRTTIQVIQDQNAEAGKKDDREKIGEPLEIRITSDQSVEAGRKDDRELTGE